MKTDSEYRSLFDILLELAKYWNPVAEPQTLRERENLTHKVERLMCGPLLKASFVATYVSRVCLTPGSKDRHPIKLSNLGRLEDGFSSFYSPQVEKFNERDFFVRGHVEAYTKNRLFGDALVFRWVYFCLVKEEMCPSLLDFDVSKPRSCIAKGSILNMSSLAGRVAHPSDGTPKLCGPQSRSMEYERFMRYRASLKQSYDESHVVLSCDSFEFGSC